jgi:hypothetical protein
VSINVGFQSREMFENEPTARCGSLIRNLKFGRYNGRSFSFHSVFEPTM